MLNQYCFGDRINGEYWFLGLKSKNVDYAYSIMWVDIRLRIDETNFIKI